MDPQLANDIISTSVGGAAGGAVAGLVLYGAQALFAWISRKIDMQRVHKWLVDEQKLGKSEFRTTRAIASHNNLTEDRVRYICSHHEKIMLSTGEKADMWSLTKREQTGLWGRKHENNS